MPFSARTSRTAATIASSFANASSTVARLQAAVGVDVHLLGLQHFETPEDPFFDLVLRFDPVAMDVEDAVAISFVKGCARNRSRRS